MHLTPHEQERLMIRAAADLVERRLMREPTLELNYPEVMALFAAYVLEEARHDTKTVAELMDTNLGDVAAELQVRLTKFGTTLPTSANNDPTINVLPGVREMIANVQVEATFKDGTKLVVIADPLCDVQPSTTVHPGKWEHPDKTPVPYNLAGGSTFPTGKKLWVKNTADRPIQVGSHYHLDDVNRHGGNVGGKGLDFYEDDGNDQMSSRPADVNGYRLHIAAGTSERFEPGDSAARRVWVVPVRGALEVWGLHEARTTTADAKVTQR
ncbi:urease subunit gamma [Streptomyces xanthophaeus]|uniref:urease subunit gamma n=1 Tax=Streptomyces xanthophaeus TaxID=67385 RepID=UPI00371C4163